MLQTATMIMLQQFDHWPSLKGRRQLSSISSRPQFPGFWSRTGDSLNQSVGWSIGRLATLLKFLTESYQSCLNATSHPDVTDAAVYAALLSLNL